MYDGSTNGNITNRQYALPQAKSGLSNAILTHKKSKQRGE